MKRQGVLILLLAVCAQGAEVAIRVHGNETTGAYRPIYGYFGYDEPNYTYTPNGTQLVGEFAALGNAPVYIRTHFLLATGDGTPGLKWGSTNAYTEDAAGKPHYDWTIADRIFDTYLQAGAKPFVEIGFMPQALSTMPEPYQREWIPGARTTSYYPPAGRTRRTTTQSGANWCTSGSRIRVAKYGRAEVASWYWEVWNEPDISYWHGTPEEYNKLYDYAVHGVKRALPEARVGGPATTGPANAKAAEYLRQFLQHCAIGTNAATGKPAPAGFHHLPRQGTALGRRWPRTDGHRQERRRCR